jgi:integrase
VVLPPRPAAGADGRRRQKRVGGFRTERDAKAALANSTVAVARGELQYGPARTFADLATEWLAAVGPNRKASTVATYGTLVNVYLVPRFGSKRVDRLTPSDVQLLYTELRRSGAKGGGGLSGTQVRNIHRMFHNVLGYAQRMGYVALNVADRVEKPRDDTAERPVYTPEQVREFLAAATEDRLRALWYLVISTGLRRAELAGLQWRDIQLGGSPPTLAVRLARTAAGHRVGESDPKTKAGRRVLVLDARNVEALEEHRDVMVAESMIRGEAGLREYVLVDESGEPYHPARLTRTLHLLQRRRVDGLDLRVARRRRGAVLRVRAVGTPPT